MALDDDRSGLGSSPVEGWPPDFSSLVIPDDARELAADARALARERRAVRRSGFLHALVRVRRWHQYPVSIAAALSALVVAVVATSLLVVFRPAARTTTAGRPLASGARPVGSEGGLLPDLTLDLEAGQQQPLRRLRPAVLVLTPAGCDCAVELRTVMAASDKHHVNVAAIGTARPTVPEDLSRGSLVIGAEPTGALAKQYGLADEPLILLVADDGLLDRVLTGIPPAAVLESEVVALTG